MYDNPALNEIIYRDFYSKSVNIEINIDFS